MCCEPMSEYGIRYDCDWFFKEKMRRALPSWVFCSCNVRLATHMAALARVWAGALSAVAAAVAAF